MQFILVNLLHLLFLHAKLRLLLGAYHGSKILQFDNESSFLLKIHVIFYCHYAKFRNAAYEKVHLDLLQSFFKIKRKALSQHSKKFVDKFCNPSFGAIVSSRKNVSNIICLVMKILTKKPNLISLTSYFRLSPKTS